MNLLIISGSQRESSMSYEVAKFIKGNVLDEISDVTTSILDLSDYPCLLENYGARVNNPQLLDKEKHDVLAQLYSCDAIVIIAPEWGGMVPPSLVNLLLLTANGSANGLPFGHKPAFAIGLSASGGGSNPISLLKGYTAKNSHLVWLPLHAIVQNVETFLAQEWQPGHKGRYNQVQSRILVGLKSLLVYARQLSPVREELVKMSQVHPFGQ